MLTRRSLLTFAPAAVLAAPLGVRAQTRYKPEYRVSLSTPPGSAYYRAVETFAKLVQERTAGRVNMKLYPGSSLVQGQQDREFTALRQGVIDVVVGVPVNWAGSVRDFGALSLPFLLPDAKAIDALLASDVLNQDYFDIVRRNGAEPLAAGEYGYVQIVNSKRRIVAPGDAKGLKMRVTASPMFQELMSELGGNPTSMSFADAQPALASGAVDGLLITMEQFVGFKLNALGLKYVTQWNCMTDVLLFATARTAWESWTPEDREHVRSAARDAAKGMTAEVRRLEGNSVATLRGLGVDVHASTPAEMAKWREATRNVYARWKTATNPQLVSKIEALVASSASR